MTKINDLDKLAVVFGGQATPWRRTLEDMLLGNNDLKEELNLIQKDAKVLLEPIANELLTIYPNDFDLLSGESIDLSDEMNSFITLPGILLSQYALLKELEKSNPDIFNKIQEIDGHSQGILGKELIQNSKLIGNKEFSEVLAGAFIIGAASQKVSQDLGISVQKEGGAMLSVKGVTKKQLLSLTKDIAVQNTINQFIISGFPNELNELSNSVSKIEGASFEYLPVFTPFHSNILKPALNLVKSYLSKTKISEKFNTYASKILVETVNFVKQIESLSSQYILDIGPGNIIAKITKQILEGSGKEIILASSKNDLEVIKSSSDNKDSDLSTLTTQDYSLYLPKNLTLPNGKKSVSTKFTRFTGLSPVMLAGMTPTTVEADIVAAASNSGHWAEMAGGGQVTAEVYNENLEELKTKLNAGASIQFNSMFLDRYLWNLQFGTTKIVSKSRASGAPINGVVITAGIPEKEEAIELVKTLNAEGFPYISFKPGTVKQILDVLNIAKAVPNYTIIMQVEDGHAGGHHSWENLDDLLLSTYSKIRSQENVILAVGGGISNPQIASKYINGTWSLDYVSIKMPVDSVMVGTIAMVAKEAKTSPQVKELLSKTKGISLDENGGWVESLKSKGGMTSSLSHLRADIYEVDNDSAKASKMILEYTDNPELFKTKKQELVKVINKTAKPYFGDIENMTYLDAVKRYCKLCFDNNPTDTKEKIGTNHIPKFDFSWYDRLLDFLQRVEARFTGQESGKIESLFNIENVKDYKQAITTIEKMFPKAGQINVNAIDSDWFIELCRKHPKPVPFVPIIDNDTFKWWSTDSLWQSHDDRYSAKSVRIIPGPVSIQGIAKANEPIADILGRFDEQIVKDCASNNEKVFSVNSESKDEIAFIKNSKHISWTKHLIDNPAFFLDDSQYTIEKTSKLEYNLTIKLDTFWDKDKDPKRFHAVRELNIPLVLSENNYKGYIPVVNEKTLGDSMFAMLAATAGVGSTMTSGDKVEKLPVMEKVSDNTLGGVKFSIPKYGRAKFNFMISENLGKDHRNVTGKALGEDYFLSDGTIDSVLGCCWPPIYSALGSVMIGDMPVIEGLLNAVHLDHTVDLSKPLTELKGVEIESFGFADSVKESVSGRIVDIRVVLVDKKTGELVCIFRERFAVQGRAYGTNIPSLPDEFGGRRDNGEMFTTKRRLLSAGVVRAPKDMTAFARVSGDYNPIHTSYNAARVAGLPGPIVHGMWLSATAQHLVQASIGKYQGTQILGWTAQWFNPTQLGDLVTLTVERVGYLKGGNLLLEVIAKIDDVLTAKFSATIIPKKVAYCFPGQGIQHQGMTLEEINKSKAVKEVWDKADKYTRKEIGFSILNVVRDNPTEIWVKDTKYSHPDGVLNLTQFTQVALTVVGYAQTAKYEEAGLKNPDAIFAGHSLGEYVAISSVSEVIPFETTLKLVFARGSAMHNLVPRDENGKSNYKMAALRPNQFGVTDSTIKDYIANASKEFGEFLEIVNFNLANSQYAVAGTIKGLKLLQAKVEEDVAKHKGKPAFILVPGIDVPFHSSKLRDGVEEFRHKLDTLLPKTIDHTKLVNKYIPNLVARPFELTLDFAKSILDVVPSESIKKITASKTVFDKELQNPDNLAKTLLVELLCWQFASPVRWIETQSLLFDKLGVENFIEFGLKNAPTLANLATKTLMLEEFQDVNVEVLNIGRDESRVYYNDDDAVIDIDFETIIEQKTIKTSVEKPVVEEVPVVETVQVEPQVQEKQVEEVQSAPVQVSNTDSPQAGDITFKASDAISAIFAYSNKLNPSQIEASDNAETLTNGASARRNQMLMDMTAELGIASIDSAAEASVNELKSMVDKLVPNYSAFGSVLGEATKTVIRKMFGSSGVKPTRIQERVTNDYGLNQGWVDFTTIEILLGTRAGDSMRGGSLTTLGVSSVSSAKDVDSLIDNALTQVANKQGVSVSLKGSSGSSGGDSVSSEALDKLSETIIGKNGIFAKTAYSLLKEIGIETNSEINDDESNLEEIVDTLNAELGSDWVKAVTPSFNENKVVELNDVWALRKEDLAILYSSILNDSKEDCYAKNPSLYIGSGENIENMAKYYSSKVDAKSSKIFNEIAKAATQNPKEEYINDTAIVTGATPTSISGAIAGKLLNGGAAVIMTASSVNSARLDFAKDLYRKNASKNARLFLVPANLSSYQDVDALCSWIGTEQKETVGATTKIIKPSLSPTLLFPFAAPRVLGKLDNVSGKQEIEARLLLWSVEKLIGNLSKEGIDNNIEKKLHVILPGSPNRGIFGGDGSYGEVKAAFDAIVNKWFVEKDWSQFTTFAHPKIGWVKGTSLMGGNDPLVDAVEAKGIHTYTTDEIANELLKLCSSSARKSALSKPLDKDLTGGLGNADFNLAELAASVQLQSTKDEEKEEENKITALPTPNVPTLAAYNPKLWNKPNINPKDMKVIVGLGEVGPWGSRRTRFEAEMGIQSDASFDISPAAVKELAWMMDLIHYSQSPKPSFYNDKDEPIDENDIYELYKDEVVARCGVRFFVDDENAEIKELQSENDVTVFTDKEISFSVPTKKDAEQYKAIDTDKTKIYYDEENGEYIVTKLEGSSVRVPRYISMRRLIGGQLPTGFNPANWGIPASMLESVDRLALWNLVSTVDAFISSGFSPKELLSAVHPSDVASTQGTGIGGTDSMHKLFVDTFLGEEKPSDILQEALPNVIAAHVMQSYVGGYGPMVHPVGACATAAVSIEDAVDKIDCGKADFVVAGAIDDIGIESITGFGDMNATADSKAMLDKGINERFVSRANDKRRGGFVEAEGGGTVLITRGDIALKLGLPVFGVIAYARSFADGAHTSIPAPGLGALGSVRGGTKSKLVSSLTSLGLTTNDISVISKHDTSTNANDPNESELYTIISEVTNRTKGNPLYVISQKTVTGHAKGGAAVFQVSGICNLFTSNKIPGNKTLDCVGEEFKEHNPITWLRSPLELNENAPVKAACLTSLGFGHVSGLICIANPSVFFAAIENGKLKEYLDNANARLANGSKHLEMAMSGKDKLFVPIEHRRFSEEIKDIHKAEIDLLLDPNGRL